MLAVINNKQLIFDDIIPEYDIDYVWAFEFVNPRWVDGSIEPIVGNVLYNDGIDIYRHYKG